MIYQLKTNLHSFAPIIWNTNNSALEGNFDVAVIIFVIFINMDFIEILFYKIS